MPYRGEKNIFNLFKAPQSPPNLALCPKTMSFWRQLGLQEGISVIIEIINYFHDYMIILLTIILFFTGYSFFVVRNTNGLDKLTIESHFLELVWTVIPMLFLIFMALPSLYLLYITEDISSYRVIVKVIAHQWYWEYQYYRSFIGLAFNSYISHADSLSTTLYRLLDVDNRLCLPASLSAMLMVTSADVLHSWTVPSIGVKADAIPGRLNYLNLTPRQYGVFYGQCSELCGTNHSFMPIVLEVVGYKAFVSYMETILNS